MVKQIANRLLPKYKGLESLVKVSGGAKTLWMSSKYVALRSGIEFIKSKIKLARSLESQLFLWQGIEPEYLTRIQIRNMQWHPIVVAPKFTPLEVIEISEVGTGPGTKYTSGDTPKAVQSALSEIMSIVDFHIVFASSHGLEAYFLSSIDRKSAKKICEIILTLNPSALSFFGGDESHYIAEIMERRLFMDFRFR